MKEKRTFGRRANARNVRLRFPYRQYTNLFIFRFVSEHCTLHLFHNFNCFFLLKWRRKAEIDSYKDYTWSIKRSDLWAHCLHFYSLLIRALIKSSLFYKGQRIRPLKETLLFTTSFYKSTAKQRKILSVLSLGLVYARVAK